MTDCGFFYWLGGVCCACLGAPLLPGIINKVKAFFAGRKGPSLFQLYFDLAKLLRKGSIYSTTTHWLLPLSVVASAAATFLALLLLPAGKAFGPFHFEGNYLLFLALLGAARFAMVLGALDTGSSFEGMGASREVQFSALAEGAVFVVLCFLALISDKLTLGGMLAAAGFAEFAPGGISFLLAACAFYLVFLCENCRVPFDDPDTHLELTMIHEAMILDLAGPDLALAHYTAALKLWILGGVFTLLVVPEPYSDAPGLLLTVGGVLLTALSVGVVESVMARYRFLKVPRLLAAALVIALVGILLVLTMKGGAR